MGGAAGGAVRLLACGLHGGLLACGARHPFSAASTRVQADRARIHGRAAAALPSVSSLTTLRQKRLFGYIVINEHDLSAEEKARYLQVYCGLCRSLQRRFGERARLLLNNDLVFMALLHLSLYEPAETVEQGTCVMHPIKDRTWAVSACTEYAADMTVLLSYYKSLDDGNDDRRRSAHLINRMLARPLAQVRERWPRQADALARCLDAVGEVERRQKAGGQTAPDEAANWFGLGFGELFAWGDEAWFDELAAFGRELGRFVYLMDAAVDLKGDLESGSYNPFAKGHFSPDDLREVLGACMGRVAAAFERLPLEQDDHLLQSVVYAGVWQRFDQVYGLDSEACEASGDVAREEESVG